MTTKTKLQSLLRLFGRNVKAGILKHRKTIFFCFTRALVSLLILLSFYGSLMGLVFYNDGLHEISLLFFAASSGSAVLSLCLICFVPSVRRAMFRE